MKKIIIALIALLAAFSCAREEIDLQPTAPDQEKDNTPMSFNLSVNGMSGGAQTKAALKADWNNGDVVYVFFDAIGTKYVKKTFDGTEWADTYPGGAFVAGDFSASGPASSRYMTAVWFPQGAVDVTYADGKFSFTIGGEKIYSHYMSVHAAYSIDGTTVTGTLDMEKPAGFVQFFVPGIAAADAPAYRLRESHLTPKACEYVALDGGVHEDDNRTAGYSLKGMAFTTDASVTGALFGGYLSSAGATTSYKFSLVKGISADKPAAEGTYTLLGYRNIAAGTSMTFPTIEGGAWGEMVPFVDLGFGDIQWATGNLKDDGTIVSPVAAGDYYQWGAIKKHGEDGDDCYSATEELPASRDIASLRSSGEWHMPSKTQFEALKNSSNSTWVTIESTNGRLVTSNVNGISLFFAAAGEYDGGSLGHVGEYGRYWSTTPEGGSLAYYLLFNNGSIGTSDDYRNWGVPVRPITGAPTPAPAPWDGNLSSLDGTEPSGFATATNGMTITGTLSANVKISIDPGATVTLDNVSIIGTNDVYYAGLTCLGDATIILKDGSTNFIKGFFENYPGIEVPPGSTLTIKGGVAGTGSLNASSNGYAPGIGGGYDRDCGNIEIQGGHITAIGGSTAAAIGAGCDAGCGTITISGGNIIATGGNYGAGIGGGYTNVDTCGPITIYGGTIEATGGINAAGIGGGRDGVCYAITITTGVTSVTATKGTDAPNSIGAGYNGSCGTVTIGGVETGPITTSPFVYKIAAAATAGDLGKVIGSNGFIYDDAAAATAAGTTALALITYVGNDAETSAGNTAYKHGLALALTDAISGNKTTWCNVYDYEICLLNQYSDETDAKTDMAGIANTDALVGHATHTHAAASAARGYNGGTHPTGTSTWFLPSAGQWDKMITAAGGSYGTLKQNASLQSGYGYWSSTEKAAYYAWLVNVFWGEDIKDEGYYVRSALAF